jgi:late competence protein required for DNA uptake (superfamily II DNA/RNA helicase)
MSSLDLVDYNIPGAFPYDLVEVVAPIPLLQSIAYRAAFFFGWSCMVVCVVTFGFINFYFPWLGVLTWTYLFFGIYFNVSLFVVMQFVLYNGFRLMAILWHADAGTVENAVYLLYAPYFSTFYDLSADSRGAEDARFALTHGMLDPIARLISTFIRPFTSWVFKKLSAVKYVPDLVIKPPSSEINFEQHVLESLQLEGFSEEFMRKNLLISEPISAWDDDLVSRQEPFVELAFLLARCVILCRLDISTIVYLSCWAVPFSMLYVALVFLKIGKAAISVLWSCLKLWFIGMTLSLVAPLPYLIVWMNMYHKILFKYPIMIVTRLLNPWFWVKVYQFVKTFMIFVFVKIILYYQFFSLLLERNQGSQSMIKRQQKLQARFNQTWLSLQLVISDISLPEYIRSFNTDFSKESLQETFDKLAALGWPVNVSVLPDIKYTGDFADWFVTKIDFNQGIHQLQCHIDADLETFEADNNLVYKRTESYASFKNELNTTARYFFRPEYQFSSIQLADAWDVFGEIFENSRLTPFNRIIQKWQKKYGLAAWAKVKGPFGRERKLSRREFIQSIGMSEFKKLWWQTFKIAPSLVPLNPVSVKREALPQKKWSFDKVRTVIGSPITQYISATIWDSFPAHNFRWQTTPSKLGMPLNGWAMGKVFSEHAKRDIHYAADCSAFDSTLSGPVMDNIAALFKKGYENHKNHNRICELIDHNRFQVENGLLALTSSGNVFNKGTGASTGHSSTSLTNTMGMGTLFLAAFREITGLSSKEFKHFNALSLYGDDNMISWQKDAPPSWNFKAVQQAMARWGVELREEATGDLEKIEFLSKFARRPTAKDISEFEEFSLDVPEWVVYHNREKLVGKIKTPLTSRRATYATTRLISYLELCAGHRDIYDSLVAIILRKTALAKKEDSRFNVRIPSYQAVLTNWYNPSSDFTHLHSDRVTDENFKDGLVLFGEMSIFDHLTNFLSRIVDVFNPDVYNSTFTNFIQRPFRKFSEWPFAMLSHANSAHTARHLSTIVQKSPYDWISNEVELVTAGDKRFATSKLFKHWLYMALRKDRGSYFSLYISGFDKKLCDLKAVLFGYLDLSVRRVDIPFWNILLVACLGAIPDVPLPDYTKIPGYRSFCDFSLGSLADQIFAFGLNKIWSLTPPNFVSVLAAVKDIDHDHPVVIQASTGTGKTTVMINLIAKKFQQFSKIVVIEPRASIVKGVVPYMQKAFGMDVTLLTQGEAYDKQARVVYCTPMEIFLHPEFFQQNTLFIVDECHVDEPLHSFALAYLEQKKVHLILTSATPQETPHRLTQLSVPNLWSIEQIDALNLIQSSNSYSSLRVLSNLEDKTSSYVEQFQIYKGFVSHYLANANPWAKSLVFVNTIKEVEVLTATLKPGPSGPVIGMWSGHTDLPDRWSIVVTTSVCDVGVTLPNVDHVFTTDTLLEVRDISGKIGPVYSRAPKSLLTQRRGRTGRTNNGRFILYKIFGLRDKVPFSFKETFASLISSGVSFDHINLVYPNEVRSLVGGDQNFSKFALDLKIAEDKVFSYARAFSLSHSANPSPVQVGAIKVGTKVIDWISDLVPATADNYVVARGGWSLLSDVYNFVSVALLDDFQGVPLKLHVREDAEGGPLFQRTPKEAEADVLVATSYIHAQTRVGLDRVPQYQDEIEEKQNLRSQYSGAVETLNTQISELQNKIALNLVDSLDGQVWRYFRFAVAADWFDLYTMSALMNAFSAFLAEFEYYGDLFQDVIVHVREEDGNLRAIHEDENLNESMNEVLMAFHDHCKEHNLSFDIDDRFFTHPNFNIFGSYATNRA